MTNILLVEPNFPYPKKSKHRASLTHKNFVPIALLKLGSYHKSLGHTIKLVRGNKSKKDLGNFVPHKILITSLFTYWSKFVWDSAKHYRDLYPKAKIIIGGIYVTLHCNTTDFSVYAKKCNIQYYKGLHEKAEKFLPDYSLIPNVNYHATHAMRGCIRKCKFCGVWKLEPKLQCKNPKTLIEEIKKANRNKVIFFDNNFLANRYITKILEELPKIRINNRVVSYESQSGFDGRILEKSPNLAILLKKARFKYPRIAWDGPASEAFSIKKQINILKKAGYKSKNITVFMIYNYDIPYEEIVKKAKFCKKWGVQISDCRYRPLDSLFDNYNSYKKSGQDNADYHIHIKSGWTDKKIRSFRKLIREQNIGVRYGKDGEYHIEIERKYPPIKELHKKFGIKEKTPKLKTLETDNKLKERMILMKKIETICRKNEMDLPILEEINENAINNYLADFYNKAIHKNQRSIYEF